MTLSDDIKRVLELDVNRISTATVHYQGIIRQQNELLREAYDALEELRSTTPIVTQRKYIVAIMDKIKTALGE